VFFPQVFHCGGFNEVDEDLMGFFCIWWGKKIEPRTRRGGALEIHLAARYGCRQRCNAVRRRIGKRCVTAGCSVLSFFLNFLPFFFFILRQQILYELRFSSRTVLSSPPSPLILPQHTHSLYLSHEELSLSVVIRSFPDRRQRRRNRTSAPSGRRRQRRRASALTSRHRRRGDGRAL